MRYIACWCCASPASRYQPMSGRCKGGIARRSWAPWLRKVAFGLFTLGGLFALAVWLTEEVVPVIAAVITHLFVVVAAALALTRCEMRARRNTMSLYQSGAVERGRLTRALSLGITGWSVPIMLLTCGSDQLAVVAARGDLAPACERMNCQVPPEGASGSPPASVFGAPSRDGQCRPGAVRVDSCL